MSTSRNQRRVAAKHAREAPPPGPVELKIGTDGTRVIIVMNRSVQRLDFTADEAMGVIQAMHNTVATIAAKARAVAQATAAIPAVPSAGPANDAAPTEPQETPNAAPPG
jgi:hypothetical protein